MTYPPSTSELQFTYTIFIKISEKYFKTMSKQKLEKTVRKELEVLNEKIDIKIIKGLPYKSEARRHKFLLSRLSGEKLAVQSSWFGRSLGFVSLF